MSSNLPLSYLSSLSSRTQMVYLSTMKKGWNFGGSGGDDGGSSYSGGEDVGGGCSQVGRVLRINGPMTMMTMTETSMAMAAGTSRRPSRGSRLALNAAYGDGFTSGPSPHLHHLQSSPQGYQPVGRGRRSTSQRSSIYHYISYRAT